MALLENNLQLRHILAQGTITLNGTTAVVTNVSGIEATSIVLLSLNTVGATPGATAPYMSALTAGTSFAVKSGTASANDVLNYIVYNQ